MNKLDSKAFGLACGILWAAGIAFMGFTALVCTWAVPFVQWLGKLYVGYDVSVVGVLIGIIWAFIDGFIGGFVLAWLYNKLSK